MHTNDKRMSTVLYVKNIQCDRAGQCKAQSLALRRQVLKASLSTHGFQKPQRGGGLPQYNKIKMRTKHHV